MAEISSHLAEIIERNTRNVCAAPGGNFAVTVLADYECVNAPRIYAEMLAEQIFESCRIKNSTRAKNSVRRESAELCRRISQYINGICNDKENPCLIIFCNFGNDRAENTYVLFYKIKPCLARFLTSACRNDYYRSVGKIAVFACVNLHRFCKRQSVAYIKSFALSFVFIRIYQHKLRKKSAFHKSKRCCAPYKSAADYSRFSAVYFYHSYHFPFLFTIILYTLFK